jgi:phospholipid transport system substrate-binding protein
MRVIRFALALVLLVLAPSGHALGAEGAATTTVRQANTTLSALLKQRPAPGSAEEKRQAADLTAKLQGFLDVAELGRRALSNHWGTLSAEQRSEFTKLLREIVEATYLRALRSQLEYQVRYLKEKPRDGNLEVRTEVSLAGKTKRQVVNVDYVLHRVGSEWRVYDLVTDGVGLVENYRAQFNKIIAKEGVPALLARMKKKLQSS